MLSTQLPSVSAHHTDLRMIRKIPVLKECINLISKYLYLLSTTLEELISKYLYLLSTTLEELTTHINKIYAVHTAAKCLSTQNLLRHDNVTIHKIDTCN